MQATPGHPALSGLPPYLARHLSTDTRYFGVPRRVTLESGATLDEVTVAYRTWGDPANAAQNAILVCHALTGSADADAWWPGMIGEGCAFDPRHDYVICSNLLGGCYGTTGPVSIRPGSRGRYRASFPRITVRDMVEMQRLLLDYLGVDRLALVTGPSLGGMQALEWALMYPERVRSIVPIGVGGRHSAWCIAMSEVQRAAIYADPYWQEGNYTDDRPPQQGLAAARMMAICGYRSWHSFDGRFGRDRTASGDFEVQSYLRHQGDKINARFDANSYVRLTQAMNEHDIARGRGEFREVIRSIRQRALVVSVRSDLLYPPHEQQALVRHLPHATYELLDSGDGHDGFLIESAALGRMIADFRRAGADEESWRTPRPARREPLSAIAE